MRGFQTTNSRLTLAMVAVAFTILMASTIPLANGNSSSGGIASSNGDPYYCPGTGESGAPAAGGVPCYVALKTFFQWTIHGNYVAKGVSLRSSPDGQLILKVPAGATITKALMLWSVISFSTGTAPNTGTLNNQVITGTLLGTSGDVCWGSNHIDSFAADVTGIAVSGKNNFTNFPDAEGILREGVALVLVYTLASDPLTQVIINEGAQSFAFEAPNTNFTFGAATAAKANTTGIVADGQMSGNEMTFGPNAGALAVVDANAYPGSGFWNVTTVNVSGHISAGATKATAGINNFDNNDCVEWVGQVLSVPGSSPNCSFNCGTSTKVWWTWSFPVSPPGWHWPWP